MPSQGSSIGEDGSLTISVALDLINSHQTPRSNAVVSAVSSDSSKLTVTPSTRTYTPGNYGTSQEFSIEGVDDDDADDESVTITFSVTGGISASSVSTLTLSESSLDINEDGSATGKTFKVKLGQDPKATRTVTVASTNAGLVVDTDTATAGNQNTLTFNSSNWEDDQTVRITAATDTTLDDETATINLTGTFVTSSSLTVNLWEVIRGQPVEERVVIGEGSTVAFKYRLLDEPPADRTVTISTQNDHTHFTMSANDSTPGNSVTLTFTQQNWNTTQTITLSAPQDNDKNDFHDAGIVFGKSNGLSERHDRNWRAVADIVDDDKTLTISSTDVDVIEGETATFTVALDSQPEDHRNFNRKVYLTSDNDDVTLNPDSLTFDHGNWSTAQTVTITAADDADTTDETLEITLGGGGFEDATVDVDLADDDSPVGLTLSKSTLTIGEDGSDTFTVKLASAPVGDRTVKVVSADTGAVTVSPATLDFTSANYSSTQTVTVRAVDDSDVNDESITINLTGATGDAITAGSATVNVTDDDLSLVLTDTPLTITEGSSGAFKVKLVRRPSASVMVGLTAAGDLTLNKSSLTFTTTNWDDDQSVTVTAGHDSDIDDDTNDISLSASGGGYNNVTATARVNVTDDDAVELVLSTTRLTVTESGSATFTVALNSAPSAGVTVRLAQPSAGRNTDVSISPESLDFTTTDWGTAKTVTVRAAEDADTASETATIDLTAEGGGYDGKTGRVTVDVIDDDGRFVMPATLTVAEGGSKDFTVALGARPTGNVTVMLAQTGTTTGLHDQQLAGRTTRHGQCGP
ncbi:MAG: hypothetical protein ISN29_12480 [Gammaproteobacteria bacterium AqS3]|nr:hypothetical protein [Gammaproteobacteria bacterium AqS3]